MVFFKKAVLLGCVGLLVSTVALPIPDASEYYGSATRQAGLLATLGATLAPIITGTLGPLLINIANGITAGVVSTLVTGFIPVTKDAPNFEAYVVEMEGAQGPYLMLSSNPNSGNTKDQSAVEKAKFSSYFPPSVTVNKLSKQLQDTTTPNNRKAH